jgi:drug/metabolite transporter (DMT)-like permease
MSAPQGLRSPKAVQRASVSALQPMTWIVLSLAAAVFYAVRYALVKRCLAGVGSLSINFHSRLFAFLALLPFAALFGLRRPDALLFGAALAATVVLTGVASVLQVFAVKRYDLSSSIPFLAFTPLFMVGWVLLLYGEMPRPQALAGLLLLSAGAWLINRTEPASARRGTRNRGGLIFLCVAAVIGLTTSLDRLAIQESGAGGYTYALAWNLASAILFAAVCAARDGIGAAVRPLAAHPIALPAQGLLAAAAFLLQMLAVENARHVAANVIHVKAITLLQLVIAVGIGAALFGEREPRRRLLGAALLLGGAVVVTAFH